MLKKLGFVKCSNIIDYIKGNEGWLPGNQSKLKKRVKKEFTVTPKPTLPDPANYTLELSESTRVGKNQRKQRYNWYNSTTGKIRPKDQYRNPASTFSFPDSVYAAQSDPNITITGYKLPKRYTKPNPTIADRAVSLYSRAKTYANDGKKYTKDYIKGNQGFIPGDQRKLKAAIKENYSTAKTYIKEKLK